MPNSHAFDPEDLRDVEHHVLESTPSETIQLGGDEPLEDQPQTVRNRFEINDRARGVVTELTLYEQGFLKLVENRGKKMARAYRLNLRYLDPAPSVTKHIAKRSSYVALGCAAAAALSGLLTQLSVLRPFAVPSAVVATTAMLIALLLTIYLTHEKIVFRTLHGRSPAMILTAGFGCIRRFHALLPALINAIEEAADTIGDDTAVFLREEMREHYRLRGDGVLTPEDCNDSTERILAQFDGDL